MAEALARRYAQERQWNVESKSAGVQALVGEPAAANAVKAIRELGENLDSHRAQAVTQELLDWADRVLVMEMGHAVRLRERFPSADQKIQLLGTFGGLVEIDDPYGRWIFAFRSSRDTIRRCVETFMDRLPANPL